jgi:hypothetical protein
VRLPDGAPLGIEPTMIARCGMDCALCYAHLRVKNRCVGCNGADDTKPNQCRVCRIKHCEEPGQGARDFCYECSRFPCARLRQLDKRYRTKYGMSMVENLERIRDVGLDAFVAQECERWKCAECGSLICVHRADCVYCGRVWR